MRNFITGSDIELAKTIGKNEISIGPNDVITGIARERADKLGIKIIVSKAASQSVPRGSSTTRSEPNGSFFPSFLDKGAAARTIDPKTSRPPYDIDAWRAKFPILKNSIHVANCSQAPQSDYTRDAALAYLDSWNSMGMDWDRWMEEIQLTKAEFAKLINADVSEISLGTSVSEATSVVASAMPYNGSRKKVVTTEAEFPTIGHVWLAHQKYGAQVEFIPVKNGEVDPNDYDRYVDENTLITSICDVYYYNGFKQNLEKIIPKIHAKGSLAYLDAYQGIGTHPIDVKALDVDFLSTGNLKYLLGIPGVSFLYVKKELIPHFQPAFTGWFGQENPFAFDVRNLDFASDARRFDTGTPPVMTAYIVRAGMQMINEVGVENIQYWTDQLSQYCIDQALSRGLEVASPLDVSKKAPTTAIRIPGGDSHAVEKALLEKNIIASARSDVIRIATHFFTRMEDIDYVLDCMAKIIKP